MSCFTNIAKARHLGQATHARYLHAKAVDEALAGDPNHRGQIGGAFINVDRVMQPGTDGDDVFKGVAGLLEDKRNMTTAVAEQQGISSSQSTVTIDGELHAATNTLPNFGNDFDIDLYRAPTDFDLHPRVALADFLLRNFCNFIGTANGAGIVGRNAISDGTTQ